MRTLLEIIAKAAAGGLLVVAFAMLARMVHPKRFAGILAAAPAVALGSLTVTCLFSGPGQARPAAAGMTAGAVGLLAYCLVVPASVQRFGTLRGSTVALGAWVVAAAVSACVVAGSAPAWAVGAAAGAPTTATDTGGGRPGLVPSSSKPSSAGHGEIGVRFAFGSGTSALAGLVAVLLGPYVGGVFLAFPATVLASLTLIADEEGQAAACDDARGATLGAIGLFAFAAVAAPAFTVLRTPIALLVATGVWVVVAGVGYMLARALGHGGDESGTR